MPSAESSKEGTIAFTATKNNIWKFGTLSVAPFDWLEASYFYYRPSDLIWGEGIGNYLDKGFNVKFVHRSNYKYVPTIALGLDDFAGTGLFTREYIVATSVANNLKLSLGLGWGKFAGQNTFKNPLSKLSKSLENRPDTSENFKLGGSLAYDKWFRGDSSFFGGIEYKFTGLRNMKVKVEYDPFDYLDFSFSENNQSYKSYDLRKKDSNINIGLTIPYNDNFSINASYLKGNTFNISFTYAMTFDNSNKKPDFNPIIETNKQDFKTKKVFYDDLLLNINRNNGLLLQTASIKNNNLDISISTADHRNALRSSSYAAYIAKKVSDENNLNFSSINVSHINAGVELNNITYITNHLDLESNKTPIEIKYRYTKLEPGNTDSFKNDEFQPLIKFPTIFTSIAPALITHIGRPSKFFYGGVNINYFNEVQFSRNFMLTSEVHIPIGHNMKDLESIPDSAMEHVRTEVVEYLKEDDIHFKRLQLDYIWSPAKHTYAKLSAGLFESMFGGVGGQFLFKPFDKNFSVSLDLFHVKQRSFEQRFNFKEYSTTTGHINFTYLLPAGIESNISYGRYLAKDDGFTLDLSRTTKSGFKSGIYFTRTDVPAELFGEGSFDKGFYFQIPLDLFSNEYNGSYSSFKLSPLTRDGGAKLIFDKDLRGLIFNSTERELKSQLNGFLN